MKKLFSLHSTDAKWKQEFCGKTRQKETTWEGLGVDERNQVEVCPALKGMRI